MEKFYDIVIIGGGPAGLAAAIYAGRAKLSTLIIESNTEGGQIVTTSEIENYPGCIADESGQSLISRMIEQAEHFGADKEYIADKGRFDLVKNNTSKYQPTLT